MSDHGCRNGRHVVGYEIAATSCHDQFEQFVAQRRDEWLHSADAVLGDGRIDDPADLAVTRFGNLADKLLLRGHDHIRGAELAWNTSTFFVTARTSL